MIACLYGRALQPFVETALRDLCDTAAHSGKAITPLAIDDLIAQPEQYGEVEAYYTLPFEVPEATQPAVLLKELLPKAQPVTSFAVQDLCWDKIASSTRMIERGVPVPETLVTSDAGELRDFTKRHEFVILKERFSSGGQDHMVIWHERGELYGDTGSHQVRLEPQAAGRRRIEEQVMHYPAPYFAQRMVGTVESRRFVPGQVLRAYVVDGEVRFWTERYRDRYTRPADWIINISLGARYRFVLNVSEETRKLALRAAEVIGARIAVVDMIRTASQGSMVMGVDTDSRHMMIDRSFKLIPDYRDYFDLDRYIARAIARRQEPAAEVRAMSLSRRR